MIWFNLKKLENRITEENLTDKDAFHYLIGISIIGVIGAYTNGYENFISFIELIVGVIITIWGLYLIFNTNKSGDGKDFFKRYFALSWVIGVRLAVFAFIALLPLAIIYYAINPDDYTATNSISETFVFLLLGSILQIIYFMLLNNSFRRVSSK